MLKTYHNAAGRSGAFIADILLSLFGYIAYIFPFTFGLAGYYVYREDLLQEQTNRAMWSLRGIGLLIILMTSCALATMYIGARDSLPMSAGGLLGQAMGYCTKSYLSLAGASVMLFGLLLIGVTLLTGLSWFECSGRLGQMIMERLKKADLPKLPKLPKLLALPAPKSKAKSKSELEDEFDTDVGGGPCAAPEDDEELEEEEEVIPEEPKKFKLPKFKKPLIKREKPEKTEKTETITPYVHSGAMPDLALLEIAEKSLKQGYTSAQLQDLSRLVETRLLEFGVEVKVMGVYPGPVITRFELDLAAGVKVSRISTLAKDLARSLSVVSVRVVEVIPGKSLVGLEIPNVHRELVRLKEVFEDSAYQRSTSPLTLALGKDISGKPVAVDLARMPHLLVAGTTGSGKSVGINAMLLSILYKATPEAVRLILIDPKMLELAVYDNIPHLLTPVVTDMKDAANALRWCVAEMDRRYQLMASIGVRNLSGYNQKVTQAQTAGKPLLDPFWRPQVSEEPEYLTELPFIVVVVDEFADMIMVVGKKVEELIARIAQKARAAGIHLILATQRPSVDVITGLIKANIPTRIAFQVSSRIDSRTILDQSGAEQLLGHGDMLYLPPGTGVPQRIHGAFVSDDEVHRVTQALRDMGKPDYIESITQSSVGVGLMAEEEEMDELFDAAVQVVTQERKASISLIQRRLKIGYNRAARLIEQLESGGIVSPLQSNGGREVLTRATSE